MRFLTLILILILSACSPGESKLSLALSEAVKDKKLTERKKQFILTEYETLSGEDEIIAREYVNQVLTAIEMGGDSTHIDTVRRQVLSKRKKQDAKV